MSTEDKMNIDERYKYLRVMIGLWTIAIRVVAKSVKWAEKAANYCENHGKTASK